MDREEYFNRFFRYMYPSENNESILPSVIMPKVYEIHSMYQGKEISEADIKRDAKVFLMGMEAGRLTATEIGSLRKLDRTLQGLLKTIEQNKGPGEIDHHYSPDDPNFDDLRVLP